MIPISHTSVDEDAVMVGAGNAPLADAAVLRSRRLDDVTCFADVAWVENGKVVWVQRHVVRVVFRGDVARVRDAGEVEEEVGEEDSDGGSELGKS